MESSTLICNCKKVTYGAIETAVREATRLDDAIGLFEEVQKATSCSTGCGRCHDKILDIIADLMYERGCWRISKSHDASRARGAHGIDKTMEE